MFVKSDMGINKNPHNTEYNKQTWPKRLMAVLNSSKHLVAFLHLKCNLLLALGLILLTNILKISAANINFDVLKIYCRLLKSRYRQVYT